MGGLPQTARRRGYVPKLSDLSRKQRRQSGLPQRIKTQ